MSANERGKPAAPLFEDFQSGSREEWISQVTKDLKGADFDKKLVWNTPEGFPVQPMYFLENLGERDHMGNLPGFAPYLRDRRLLGNRDGSWTVSQTHDSVDPAVLKQEISLGTKGGQRRFALRFHPSLQAGTKPGDDASRGVVFSHPSELSDIADVLAKDSEVELLAGLSSPVYLAMSDLVKIGNVHVACDPIAVLLEEGSLPWEMDVVFDLMADSIRFAEQQGIDGVVEVGASVIHDAGGNAVEEVAAALATGVEYLSQMQKRGLSVDTVLEHLRFNFPVGNAFFMEVAKLRAARSLWARIVSEFGVDNSASAGMRLHVRDSSWTKTMFDPYVNMLRSTVQAMAGVIGGAEALDVSPFDEVAGQPGPFSRRIARNVQIVLKEEAHLGQVIDPAAGSYYVEALTDEVARHAWELFREIEGQGGMLSAIERGWLQERVSRTSAMKQQRISRRQDVFVGTNQYPNLTEKPLSSKNGDSAGDTYDWSAAMQQFIEKRADVGNALSSLRASLRGTEDNRVSMIRQALEQGLTVPEILAVISESSAEGISVQALRPVRATEGIEILRRAVERSEHRPRVFLATYGPVFWRRARATFASGFFGVAGMDIDDNTGFSTAQEAGEAAASANADIVVACSEDESYADTVPELLRALRSAGSKAIVIVAGNPADVAEQLRAAGVHDFIHVRSDLGATLRDILTTLEIEIQE